MPHESARDAPPAAPEPTSDVPDIPPETHLGRRDFLLAAGLGIAAGSLVPAPPPAGIREAKASPPSPSGATSRTSVRSRHARDENPHDAWIEVNSDAIRANAREVSRMAEGRSIVAVVKNNGYGLGTVAVARALDALPEVATLGVVKVDEAFELLEAGVTTPILLMGLAPPDAEEELARRGVRLTPYTDDAPDRLSRLARALDRPVPVHLYIDSGMGRLGMPDHRALPWLEELTASRAVAVEGTMTELAETEYDDEQLRRFHAFAAAAREAGFPLGRLHAAASHALFFRPGSLLSAVRPGLALFGAFPAGARALGMAELRPAHRLRARIIRVERLRPGDAVSYGRNWIAERPVWVAVVAAGHADGYPRRAVDGCRVLVGERSYPVIGAVSASHTVLEIGDEPSVSLGDVATLVGPDDPAIHPNTISERAEISVYDVLMHLGGHLPKVVSD